MAVCGVGRLKPRGERATTKRADIRCHACRATTKVSYKHPGDIERSLNDRNWTCASGAICCPDHPLRVLPRHRWSPMRSAA